MAKKVATKTKKHEQKVADIKMYVVSAAVSKKGARDLFYGEETNQKRQFAQVQPLEQAVATMRSWEANTQYYRDVRLHELGEGKKVKISIEVEG